MISYPTFLPLLLPLLPSPWKWKCELKMNNLTLIFTLTLFFHLGISLSSDPMYGKCPSKTCGNVNISYPFRIIDQQHDYCGYPGFDVSCRNDKFPIVNISGNSYVIQQIGYNTQSFRVTNSVFMDSSSNCSNSIWNLTLQDSEFKLPSNYSEIELFVNCPTDITQKYEGLLKCGGLALYRDDPKVKDLRGKCGGVVSVPVEGGVKGNISEVLRRGIELKWTGNNCSDCVDTGGQCGIDKTNELKCFCYDRAHALHCVPRKKKLGLIIGLNIAGSIILLTTLLICWYRKNIQFIRPRFVSRSTSLDRSSSDLEKGNLYFGVPLFSYAELVEATDNFNGSRELGDGGFGTVYYGTLKDGREVAVKRLYEKSYKRVEQFMNEVQILTCLRHLNLVSLYGCTSHHSKELLLVYEYVQNGTVADHLHGDKVKSGLCLPWNVRMRIAIETASALSYLHASDIIHRDVKTNNILLDGNFGVKVADFGLSRLFPNDVTHVSTAPQGTPGYVDPEYHQCYQLTDKSDVYSFGVVLVELISSLPAVDMNRQRHEINLSNYAMSRIQRGACNELVDHELGFTSDFRVRKMTTLVAELAFRCLQHEKEFRPSMDEVSDTLRRIEGTDYKALKDDDEVVRSSSKEDSSLTEKDEAQHLCEHKDYESPISVMDKWNSSMSTTTAHSSSN